VQVPGTCPVQVGASCHSNVVDGRMQLRLPLNLDQHDPPLTNIGIRRYHLRLVGELGPAAVHWKPLAEPRGC
jgi:hypothetical protein